MIRVAMTSELSQQWNDAITYIILAALFLTMKSFSGAFSSNSGLDVREVKTDCESVIVIFWDKVFIVRNTVKKENVDV